MNFFYRFARLRVFYLLLVLLSTQLAAHAQTNEGLVPDSVELRVLRQFYYSTGGPGWVNTMGWPTTSASWQAATITQAASWTGVKLLNGDIIEIRLPYTNLTGSIPAGLGQISALQTLELSANQLTGSIPAELGNLNVLRNLYLNNNQLTGSIPAELGQLKALEYLYMYNNKLTGSIPAELGQLSSLQFFYLNNNQLTGSIPNELGQIKTLISLYVHRGVIQNHFC